jgi:hypothetical protein
MNNFDETEELINELMIQGAIEVVGVDSATGDFLYGFTEKLEQINPRIHKAMLEDFYDSVMILWEKGFLSMDISEDNPMVRVTPKIFDAEAVSKLFNRERSTLQNILSRMSER